jgi:hypothetical protein
MILSYPKTQETNPCSGGIYQKNPYSFIAPPLVFYSLRCSVPPPPPPPPRVRNRTDDCRRCHLLLRPSQPSNLRSLHDRCYPVHSVACLSRAIARARTRTGMARDTRSNRVSPLGRLFCDDAVRIRHLHAWLHAHAMGDRVRHAVLFCWICFIFGSDLERHVWGHSEPITRFGSINFYNFCYFEIL